MGVYNDGFAMSVAVTAKADAAIFRIEASGLIQINTSESSRIGLAANSFTLDLTAVPVLKELTHLPVIVDPSHAPGRRSLVEPLSLAAAAAGADGIIVEIHPSPEDAICDAAQQLDAHDFERYAGKVEQAAAVAGKSISVVA